MSEFIPWEPTPELLNSCAELLVPIYIDNSNKRPIDPEDLRAFNAAVTEATRKIIPKTVTSGLRYSRVVEGEPGNCVAYSEANFKILRALGLANVALAWHMNSGRSNVVYEFGDFINVVDLHPGANSVRRITEKPEIFDFTDGPKPVKATYKVIASGLNTLDQYPIFEIYDVCFNNLGIPKIARYTNDTLQRKNIIKPVSNQNPKIRYFGPNAIDRFLPEPK